LHIRLHMIRMFMKYIPESIRILCRSVRRPVCPLNNNSRLNNTQAWYTGCSDNFKVNVTGFKCSDTKKNAP